MKVFKYNPLLIICIVVGLVAAMLVNFDRHRIERDNMTVDLAIDYEGLLEIAEREGISHDEILKRAKEAGITSLAVYETMFKKFEQNGKASATTGAQILERYSSGSLQSAAWREKVERGEIIGTEIYLTGHNPLTLKELKEDLIERLGAERVREMLVDGVEVLAVKHQYKTFFKMNLGLPTDEMKAVNDAGFFVLARPSNYQEVTEKNIRAMFKRLDGIKVSEMVFSDKEVTGAPSMLAVTAEEMNKRGIVLGLIEDTSQLQFLKQAGLLELAKLVDYRCARLYTITKDELPKLGSAGAVQRWRNADAERNIRINLLRIHEKPEPGLSLLETNMKHIKAVADALKKDGYTLGMATVFAPYYPAKLMLILMMLGVSAGVVLYISLVWNNMKASYQYALLAIFSLVSCGLLFTGKSGLVRLAASLAAANFFPVIAVIWQLDRIRGKRDEVDMSLPRFALTAFLSLLVTGTLSFVGAAYLSGVLADVEFFLEVSIFRGIKLTFVLPLFLAALAFLQRFDVFDGKLDDTEGMVKQLKKILDMPVKLKTLAIIFGVLLAGVVFVARSGHNMGMPVSGLELRFRAFLEQVMYARPRTKELMIGHPAFMLAAYAWYKRWPTMVFFALVMAAVIGQGSMVETFAHMRTPVFMSFMRGLGGIVLGGIIGACLMAAAEFWQCMMAKAQKELKALQ